MPNVMNDFFAARDWRDQQMAREQQAQMLQQQAQEQRGLNNSQNKLNYFMAGGLEGSPTSGPPAGQTAVNQAMSAGSNPAASGAVAGAMRGLGVDAPQQAQQAPQARPGQPNLDAARRVAMGSNSPELFEQFQRQYAQLGEAEQAAAQERITMAQDTLGELLALPVHLRPRLLASPQFQQRAAQLGFTPDQLSQFDPSDENIQVMLADVGGLREAMGTQELPSNVRGLQFRANEAGLVPGTPEYQAFMASGGRQQRTTPLVQVTNSGPPQPDPFTVGLNENDAGRAQSIRDTAQAAQQTISNVDILADTLLDPSVYTGTGAQATLGLRRVAMSFGLDTGVSASELANTVSNEMALALKDRLPGPMSDGDRQFLMSIPPNLGNTRAGNAALIFMTRRRAQYEQQLAASMDAAIRGAASPGEAYRAWEQQQRDMAINQPLFTEEDRRAVQLLLNGAEFRRSGNDIYVIDGDEAIRLGN